MIKTLGIISGVICIIILFLNCFDFVKNFLTRCLILSSSTLFMISSKLSGFLTLNMLNGILFPTLFFATLMTIFFHLNLHSAAFGWRHK